MMSFILLSNNMNPFYANISSFPTVFFTFALLVCVIYWAGAVLGLINIDVLDIDFDALDGATSGGEHSSPDVLAGLMLKFGLAGVPVTVSLSILFLIGWLICYYAVHFLLGAQPSVILRYLLGIPIVFGSLVIAAWITGFAIRPLKKLFAKATQQTHKHIIGQTVTVRTSRVDNNFGEAVLEDGGAGLILKVRSTGDDRFTKGDRVVIFESLNNDTIYRVISETEFIGR